MGGELWRKVPFGRDSGRVAFVQWNGLVKVRATVGHDSYERLMHVIVPLGELWVPAGLTGASPIADPLKNPEAVGLSPSFLTQKAVKDDGVAEFCRFYVDRRKQELTAAAG